MRSFGYAGDFLPELFGVVIFAKNRDVELVFRQAIPFGAGDQFPSVGDGVLLEIVAERKVAEHFEERVMAAGIADIFQIVMLAARAHTFLRCGGARIVALFQVRGKLL